MYDLPLINTVHEIIQKKANCTSVGYKHRSLEILLGSLENLPARRALVLEMLEKNFA